MKAPKANSFKGGPGSGPHRGQHQQKPGSETHKPNYSEQPSSVNPGKPRSGISPRDLFPERQRRKP